jgi:hypothetical protein
MERNYNVWIAATEDGKFHAISLGTPRFCLEADSEEEAANLAHLAFEQYHSGKFIPRKHSSASKSLSSVRPIRKLRQEELVA